MAELCQKYPERFPGFIGTAGPMNNPEDAVVEDRVVRIEDLGAARHADNFT